jgi:membrane protein insertase Oxa1/YidC/SpoIIIJ
MMANDQTTTGFNPLMLLVWAWVGLPFAYGIYELFQKVSQLFGG